MIARCLQGLVLALLAAALAWLAWGLQHGWAPGWLLAGLLPILLPQAPLLALEFALLAAFGRDPAVPRATPAQLVRAWAGEVWASGWVFGWAQPFRADRQPDGVAQPGCTGVLLLHGYCCNRGLWGPWQRALAARGVPCTALTLAPPFGSIDDWVPAIDAAVAELARRTGRPPLLVAHSMGGLAARAWLLRAQAAGHGPSPVLRVMTLGTPHQGTWMARFGHTRNARQMRPGSPWLVDLARREAALATAGRPAVPFTCFYGHGDNIVFPASTATRPGADNRHLAGVAHVRMVWSPEPLAEALRLVLNAPPT